jgi:hypothetical protein
MNQGASVPRVTFLVLLIGISAAVGVFTMTGPATHGAGPFLTQPASVTSRSAFGLNLSLSLGSFAVSPGGSVSVGIGERNTLPIENTVAAASKWPLPGMTLGPCAPLAPVGIEVAKGFYTASNLSGAAPLQFYRPGVYFCADESYVDSYTFEPNSDVAAGSYPEGVSFTLNVPGFWTGGTPPAYGATVLNNFTSGVYTVAGGDEWGALALLHFVVGANSTHAVILPAGTSIAVSSSFDCVAGHYALNFSVAAPSTLTGGFSAGRPGVTAYVATAQQGSSTFQGHPASWVYSTGLVNSTRLDLNLSVGTYVLWIEGADMNCGAGVVMPLEMLTQVAVTQSFTLTS